MLKEQKNNKPASIGRKEIDVNDDCSYSLDEMQIWLNKLRTDDRDSAFEFFIEYLENNLLPPAIYPGFQGAILSILPFLHELTDESKDNFLDIITTIAEFLVEIDDFGEIFDLIWAEIPRHSAFFAASSLIEKHFDVASLFINSEYLKELENIIQTVSNQDIEPILGFFMALAHQKELFSHVKDLYTHVFNYAISYDYDIKKSCLSILTQVASFDAGVTYIQEHPHLVDLFKGIHLSSPCLYSSLKLIESIVKNTEHPLKVLQQAECLHIIVLSFESDERRILMIIASICYCIALDESGGIQYLLDSGILMIFFRWNEKPFSIWLAALRVLCQSVSFSDDIMELFIENGFIDYLAEALTCSDLPIILQILIALQNIIATKTEHGDSAFMDALLTNDSLFEEISSVMERFPGTMPATVASIILKEYEI